MSLRDMVKSLVIQEGFKPISPMCRFKHLTRMIPGHLLREMLQAFPTRRRPRGRPRTCWRDYASQPAWKNLWCPPGRDGKGGGSQVVSA